MAEAEDHDGLHTGRMVVVWWPRQRARAWADQRPAPVEAQALPS
jgi:hypothetical protein